MGGRIYIYIYIYVYIYMQNFLMSSEMLLSQVPSLDHQNIH